MSGGVVVFVPTEREASAIRGIPVHICGVGMAECAASVAEVLCERKPSVAVLAGIAGSYSDDLRVGETVVVSSERVGDLGRLSEDGFVPLFQRDYFATVVPEGFRSVVSNTVSCAGGIAAENACAAEIENMEGAAFFAVCERLGVRAVEVRTVSNRVGEAISAAGMELAAGNLAVDLVTVLSSL